MSGIDRLVDIMARLRDPQRGCPWDLEQDFASIAPYTIEEAYEVDDAIRRGDMPELRDELGDLLLQVVFHAQMAREAEHFDFEAVVAAVCDKMERRHPHVFGDAEVATSAAQTDAWEKQKAAERASRGEKSVLDGVAKGLPALLRARKLLSRAARAGFAWPGPESAAEKIDEELAELRAELEGNDLERVHAELGDLLLAVAGVAHTSGVDPEHALRDATARFESRLRHVESALGAQGRALHQAEDAELDARWAEAKKALG
jgi:MazG family protein